MLVPDCRLVLFDRTDSALLLFETAGGRILTHHPLPPDYRLLTMLDAQSGSALLAANSRTDCALYRFRYDTHEFKRLPHALPPVTAACLAPHKDVLYLTSMRRTLYRLDLTSGALTALGSAPHTCSTLAAGSAHLYSVWETDSGSICAVHDLDGRLLAEYRLSGTIPSLCLAGDTLCLPFVGDKTHGDGLHLLQTAPPFDLTTISLRPSSLRGLSAYPYSVLVQGDTLHLISESSGTITKLDRRTNEIIGSYALGRSISRLHLLPDDRFAIATSNMFADLTLLDLVNEKLLSISICPHELFHQVIVLPPA